MRFWEGDRRWGLALVGFVALQLVFLYLDVVVLAPPAPDAPIEDLHTMVSEHGDLIAWHPLVTLGAFFGLFVPGVVGLRGRLRHYTSAGRISPDIAVAGALFIVVTLIVAEMSLVVLGLVPSAEISDSLLRAMVMINTYAVWVAGAFALALFVGAVAVAMLKATPHSRWLGRAGLVTAGISVLGTSWLVGRDFDSPFFALGMLGRVMFLGWMVAIGVWLYRTSSDHRGVGTTPLGEHIESTST